MNCNLTISQAHSHYVRLDECSDLTFDPSGRAWCSGIRVANSRCSCRSRSESDRFWTFPLWWILYRGPKVSTLRCRWTTRFCEIHSVLSARMLSECRWNTKKFTSPRAVDEDWRNMETHEECSRARIPCREAENSWRVSRHWEGNGSSFARISFDWRVKRNSDWVTSSNRATRIPS